VAIKNKQKREKKAIKTETKKKVKRANKKKERN
jgi:hypothetical protein